MLRFYRDRGALSPLRFTHRDVEEAISGLNPKKPMVFNINQQDINGYSSSGSKIISYVINAVLCFDYLPEVWKVYIMTVIHMQGTDNTNVNSYIPISLLTNKSNLYVQVLITSLTKFGVRKGIFQIINANAEYSTEFFKRSIK